MIESNEVLLRSGNEWLNFTKPHRILRTAQVNEVQDLLHEVEGLVDANRWHAAGFVSYEAAPAFDRALQVTDAGGFPLAWFGLYPEPSVLTTLQLYQSGTATQDRFDLGWRSTVERESYNTAIGKIKDYIAQGRTYQVNYTMQLIADFVGSEWDFFLRLAQNQNRYAAYVDTGDYAICSASPELFFQLEGASLTCRPMKGTIKRGMTTAEDAAQTRRLQASPKNMAENVMIVDMIRNDLGRIAEIGSVTVPELFTIEKYATLFQMTSTVRARSNASLTEIFAALFPSASVTGAPKVSTMKIIAELEAAPRRIYTGSIGHFSPGRKAQFSVAIRTVQINKGTRSAQYGLGGGIVWDSTADDEYQEALLKSQILGEMPPEFSLLETILWTPTAGYHLREKHIARMEASAEYFDFAFSRPDLEAYLDETSRGFDTSTRLRLLLSRSGELSSEFRQFQPHDTPYRARLAAAPVDSGNVFLFHKTTQRDIYENALKVSQIYNDVLLYNERDELTEFTIGNLVVELDGVLVTPPISCGLLAGTFRADLLESGRVTERIIGKNELGRCSKIFLVNSLRGWVTVQIK